MNITYLFKYLWRKKWLVLIPTVVALAATWWYFRNQDKTYTSVAELSTGYMEVNPLSSNPYPNNAVLFNNVIQTLQSNQVLDQVSYSLLLHDLNGESPFRNVNPRAGVMNLVNDYPGGKAGLITALNGKVDSFYVLNLANADDKRIRQIADLYGYSPDDIMQFVKVTRIEGSDFIDVTSTTTSPLLSAFISNTICRTFLGYYQNRQGRASTLSLDTLRSIMNAKKQLLDNKLKLLQGGSNFDATSAASLLAGYQSQLSQQKNNQILAQATLDNVNKQIAASGKKGGLANNEDIIALRANIDNLYAKYVNGGSTDAALLGQINKLRNDLQQKLSAVDNSNSGGVPVGDLMRQRMNDELQVDVANQTIKELQGKINELKNVVQSSNSGEAVVQSIQNEIEVARQDYMNASSVYNEALNRNIFSGNNFKLTMIASPPLYPDPSKKVKKVAFAGFGVFFALTFILLFFELMDQSIKSPTYLKENINVPLIANLRRINMKDLPVEQIFSANGSLPEYKKGYREQIKQLRYEVENSGKKVFLVAGYQAGSGRTTLIRAIAGSLSLKDNKILLIDANFHDNALSQQYQAAAVLEKLEMSNDMASNNRELNESVTDTGDPNVKVLGCSSGDYTPEEALPGNNIFTVLKKNEFGFNYVFIDCAALSKGPDCKELLKYTDAVILLFAADHRLTEEDNKFMEFLKKENVYVLGSVLNRINKYNMAG